MEIPKIILKKMYKKEFPLLVFKTYYKACGLSKKTDRCTNETKQRIQK